MQEYSTRRAPDAVEMVSDGPNRRPEERHLQVLRTPDKVVEVALKKKDARIGISRDVALMILPDVSQVSESPRVQKDESGLSRAWSHRRAEEVCSIPQLSETM